MDREHGWDAPRLAIWWIRLGIRPERIAPAQFYLSGCLTSELVGLEEIDDGRWKVHFGPVVLGFLDLRSAKDRGERHFGTLVRLDGQVTVARH
jgi:hypothetical protein